jgi:RNA:NAD 2'-phosphotransferase (TPT1/KptA family)
MEMMMSVDATDRVLDQEVEEARERLLEVARTDEHRWWSARELKVRARNGWSSGVMGLALRALVAEGKLEQRRSDLRVQLRQ